MLDEAAHIGATVADARLAAADSAFEAEVIVVDDGSTDGSGEAAAAAGARVVSQRNRGRLEARRSGLHAAAGEYVLLLDSRVRIHPGALAFVAAHLDEGRVWNAHVEIDSEGNAYARFWDVVAALAFARYFDEPRTTSFGPDDFDAFPKGTTCFFAPRALLAEAYEACASRYADPRHANDDTPLIRWLASRERIWISPQFGCTYRARTSLSAFVRHAFHRGIVFLDGHGRRESRYRPVVFAFYPLSVLSVGLAVVWWPVVPTLAVLLFAAAASAALAKRRPLPDVVAFAALAPVYAVAHGLGMWRALALPRR